MVYRACGSQSGDANAALAAAGGDKQRPGAGGTGRVPGRREPPGQSRSGLTSGWRRSGGPGGAEVVVRRNGQGSAADHRPGRIAEAGSGGSGATRGTLVAAALAGGALTQCSRCCWARSTNWNVQTADCDVTKGPARLASQQAER